MTNPFRRRRSGVATATVAAVAVAGVLAGSAPAAAEDERVITGSLQDSTPFRFIVPDDWNGTVFVDLDFGPSGPIAPHVQHLLDDGAAYGGTTRSVTGWDIASAIDNQIEALRRFAGEVGTPERAITMGASMGGFVAAGVAQRYPSLIDGVVSMCGGLSGSVSQWNQKLDTVFVLSNLLDPEGSLPVVDIPADVNGSVDAWRARLAEAQATPEGRARIALAAAIGQLPAYSSSAPRPEPRDVEAYQAGWYGALSGDGLPYIGQAMSSRRSIEALVGGNPSWNTGIVYADQFRKLAPDARRVVEKLYKDAGLSLADDLAQVDAAPRIEADPAAVERFEKGIEFDGNLEVPVVTLVNIGDQISTVAQQEEYERVVKKAGNADLLRQTYVDSAGHCAFTAAERVAAAELLLHRLDTGKWQGRENHQRMNDAARALGLGDARFIPFSPDTFNRPYTASLEPTVETWVGQLANGTAYNIHLPSDWSGILVMDADLRQANDPRVRWLMEQGYAAATRSRDITDWAVGAGASDLVELKGTFEATVGRAPTTTIVAGGSLGGLVTRETVDTYGAEFDGAIPMCGGGAGLVGMWNHRLDATWVLDVLVGDEPIELVDITDQTAADAALAALVDEAMSTPEGRARVALAGAIGHVSGWPAGAERPAADDYATQLDTIADSISIMLLRRSVLEATAGGNISWNVGVDYRAQLEQSGQTDIVLALYDAAGLDLASDLEALETAPRVEADAAAVAWTHENGVYSGELPIPVLDMYTGSDPRAALSEMNAYRDVVAAAGSTDRLRQVVVERSGHCAFTAGEYAAAVDALLERIDRPTWGAIAKPGKLNQRAAALQAATSIDLGGAAFVESGEVPDFPRTFGEASPMP